MATSPPGEPNVSRHIDVIETPGAQGYRLLDSGRGRKLERFGQIVVDRPEPQALWQPRLPGPEWGRAHAVFSASGEDDEKGKWRVDREVPETWPVKVGPVTMGCRLQGLWHLGLFPEQQPHWDWMVERIRLVKAAGETPRVLNLFGYTGAASLLAAAEGAEVTHVDASKKAIQWGKDNQAASKLGLPPFAGCSMTRRSSQRARCGGGRPNTSFSSIPPSSGAGPMAKSGICSRACRRCSTRACSCLRPSGLRWCLPSMPFGPPCSPSIR